MNMRTQILVVGIALIFLAVILQQVRKQKLGLRCDLKDLHLEEEQIAELVKISRHPNLYNNPVEITDEMLDKMYRYLAN